MPHRVSFRLLLVVTLLAVNGLAARGATVDDDDHHMEEEEHEEETVNSCPSQADLIEQFNLLVADHDITVPGNNETLCQITSPPDVDHVNITTVQLGGSRVLTCESIYQVCQQLIREVNLTTEECLEGHVENSSNNTQSVSAAEAYGLGFLMVMFVCLGSLVGIVLVPLIRTNSRVAKIAYEYTYAFMIAMGASALVTDAILHLIPHAFGLHGHEEDGGDEHGEDEHGSEESIDFVWKGCLVLGGIYAFALLEIGLHFLGRHIQERVRKGTGTKTPEDGTHHHCHEGDVHYSSEVPNKCEIPTEKSEQASEPQMDATNPEDGVQIVQPKLCDLSCNRIKPVAWLIILGDGLHNFADGLALGAAIAQSVALGLGTMVALIFHEIPHELGDYAILLKSGIHWCTALFFNFCCSLTSVLGFFIGVAISAYSDQANGWILAIAAGLFIYIALVDLLPEIVHGEGHSHGGEDDHHHKEDKLTNSGHHWWIRFGLINLGFFVSFAILLVLAVYEESLEHII